MRIKNFLEKLLGNFDNNEYIDLQNKDSIRIIEMDNKEVLNIKKEINHLIIELDKNINLDILLLYKQEFDKEIKQLNDINHKYIKVSKMLEDEKIGEKIKKAYNKLSKNIISTNELVTQLKEIFNQKYNILKKKEEKIKPLTIVSKDKIENPNDTKIDALGLIKKMNSDVNIYHQKLLEIKKKHRSSSENELKYELYFLKDKIIGLKKEYSILEKRKEFKKLKSHVSYDNIDTNKLIKSSASIETLYNLCQKELDDFNIPNEKPKKEKFVVTKKDSELITSSINEDIKNANIEIAKIRNLVLKANPKLKDRALCNGINQFIESTSKLSFSMFPIVLFKNKTIGTLISSILVNNIEKQIINKTNTMTANKNVLMNTLDQLDKLVLELKYKYRYNKEIEIGEIINKISTLKGQISSLKDELEDNIKISKMYNE